MLVQKEIDRLEKIIKLIFRGLLPVVLLLSGIVLLSLRIAGWSIIFGLPMVVIGVVFLIYTYDEVVSKKTVQTRQVYTCSICGQPAIRLPTDPLGKAILCPTCKKKKEQRRQ